MGACLLVRFCYVGDLVEREKKKALLPFSFFKYCARNCVELKLRPQGRSFVSHRRCNENPATENIVCMMFLCHFVSFVKSFKVQMCLGRKLKPFSRTGNAVFLFHTASLILKALI